MTAKYKNKTVLLNKTYYERGDGSPGKSGEWLFSFYFYSKANKGRVTIYKSKPIQSISIANAAALHKQTEKEYMEQMMNEGWFVS